MESPLGLVWDCVTGWVRVFRYYLSKVHMEDELCSVVRLGPDESSLQEDSTCTSSFLAAGGKRA